MHINLKKIINESPLLMKNYNGALILPFLLFIITSYLAAMREYSLAGSLLIFSILITFTIGVGAILRAPATFSALVSFVLVGVGIADAFKFNQVRSHLQFTDFKILAEFVYNSDFSILLIYWPQILIGIFLFATFFSIVVKISQMERKLKCSITYKMSLMIGISLLAISTFSMSNLLSSTYITGIRSQNLHSMMVSLSNIRLSVLLVNFVDNIGLSRQFKRDINNVKIPKFNKSKDTCNDCPDLIIVHLESVFDPKLTKSYQDEKSLGEYIVKGFEGYSGLLKTNIWGGFSWVSEFELLCGVNHKLYGPAGLYTHYNIAPYFEGCTPKHLLDLNYETTALYTSPRTFLNVGNAFATYGITRFIDSIDLGLPSNSKFVTDKMMIDSLLTEMETNSSNPSFYFMSSNTNHSPHGSNYAQPKHQGIYNISLAENEQLADYINRLNITLDAIEILKTKINKSNRPTAILFYGDHHPHFSKQYKDGVDNEIGFDPDYATVFAVIANKAMNLNNTSKLQSHNLIMTIETVLQEMLEFANVPLSEKQVLINNITEKCNDDQMSCNNNQKSVLRVINSF